MAMIESLGPWLPLVVFLAMFLESAAFLGLVVPGETVAIVAGAAAAIRGDGPTSILVAAVIGAVIGDSVGFGLGRRYGVRITRHHRLRRHRERLERSRLFVERRGVWSLVIARFISVLRALVPFSAGTAGMSYTRFFVGNVIGGVLWGVGVAGLGYLAGTRWHIVESWLARIGITVAVTALLVGGVVWSARWVARNPERTRAMVSKSSRIPVVGRLLAACIAMLRLPRSAMRVFAHVAAATLAMSAFVFAGWIDWSFVEGRVLLDILGADPIVREGARRAADAAGLIVAAIVIVGVAVGSVRWKRLTLLASATGVTAAISALVSLQIHRPSVDLPGLGPAGPFPDVVTAAVAALVLSTAWPLTKGWASGARLVGAAIATSMAFVGVRLMALQVRPVDAVAGLLLGVGVVVWTAAIVDPRLGAIRPSASRRGRQRSPSGVLCRSGMCDHGSQRVGEEQHLMKGSQ